MGKVIRRNASVRQKAIDIVRSGGTICEAALATGYGRDYVRQLCAKAGIRFSTKKYNENEIINMFKNGYAVKNIATKLNIKSLTTVRNVLKKNGIATKKKKIPISYETRYCKFCNKDFSVHPNHNKIYCSSKCERSAHQHTNDLRRRGLLSSAIIDQDITLRAVANRDQNICYLCGMPVNWNDYKLNEKGKKIVHAKYPSIDHVLALSNGGMHSWDNVKLAHIGCNAAKGVKASG